MSTRNPFTLLRYGLAVVQSIAALWSAEAVLHRAHNLFLGYYEHEWEGIQLSGVNGCAGTEQVVNGDLFSGETLCNAPVNFVPWIELYRRHWQVAALYYGCALLVILVIGYVLFALQRRLAPRAPFGETVQTSAADSEHLR